MLLITIPFWSNLLVRTLAIMFIIRDEGLVNDVLMWLGMIDQPITMLYTNFAILLGLLYSFLPFMVLPLYASLEKLDFRLVEAGLRSLRHAAAGAVAHHHSAVDARHRRGLPAGLHPRARRLCHAADPRRRQAADDRRPDRAAVRHRARNWPFGSAQALILMAVVLVALFFYVRNTTGEVRMARHAGRIDDQGPARLPRHGASSASCVLYVPILILMVFSFNSGKSSPIGKASACTGIGVALANEEFHSGGAQHA